MNTVLDQGQGESTSASPTGGSTVNLGPLTTLWYPPTSCTQMYVHGTENTGWAAQSCSMQSYTYVSVDDISCRPPRSGKATTLTSVPLSTFGYYSPGISCPYGYSTACTQFPRHSDFQFVFRPATDETAIGCCPSGFTCAESTSQTCMSLATSSFEAFGCYSNGSYMATTSSTKEISFFTAEATSSEENANTRRAWLRPAVRQAISYVSSTATSVPSSITPAEPEGSPATAQITASTSLTTKFDTVTIRAPFIQLIMKESDLTRTIPMPSISSTTVTISTGSFTSAPSPKHMSAAAIAGTSIGALAGLAAIAGLVIMYLTKIRKKRNGGEIVELGGQSAKIGELAVVGQEIHEAPGDGVMDHGLGDVSGEHPQDSNSRLYWDAPYELA